jgi:hypothetical protein
MAHSASDDIASMGLLKPEILSPKQKPRKLAFDFHDAPLGAYGFTTPLRKNKQTNDHALFDSFDVLTPGRKRVTHASDDQCSTVAPSPASTSIADASPWPSPFSSSTPLIDGDVTSILPNPFGAAQLWPCVDCFTDKISNLSNTLEPPSGSNSLHRVVAQSADLDMVTPPATPRNVRHVGRFPKLPYAPTRKPTPPLLTALQVNSVEMVRDAIEDDADASKHPFWEHNNEPPLCSAARLCCDAPIISHLLESRADVNATNAEGNTALDIARRPVVQRRGDDVGLSDPIFAFTSALPLTQNKKEVERLLLAAGACTSATAFTEESSTLPETSCDKDINLPRNQDFYQLDAGSVWPTMAPWKLDVASINATLESLVQLTVNDD